MPLRVVIVDDAPVIRAVIKQMLANYHVAIVGEAEDGEAGVTVSLRERPEVVLMDMNMPIKNGVEATREILANAPSVRVIALSTPDHEAMLGEALNSGCVDVITKPFRADDLLRALLAASGRTSLAKPRAH